MPRKGEQDPCGEEDRFYKTLYVFVLVLITLVATPFVATHRLLMTLVVPSGFVVTMLVTVGALLFSYVTKKGLTVSRYHKVP